MLDYLDLFTFVHCTFLSLALPRRIGLNIYYGYLIHLCVNRNCIEY